MSKRQTRRPTHSTALDAPFTIRPEILRRLRELRGEQRLAFVTVYHRASETAVHAAVRDDDTVLSVAISSPTPEAQARREASAMAPYLPEGAGMVFEILNPDGVH